MRSWALWAQPRRVRATVLAVELVAIAVSIAVSITWAGRGPLSRAEVDDAVILGFLAVFHTELALGVERVRLLVVTRRVYVGLTSVWTFAAALHLSPTAAAGVAVVVQAYVWLRTGRAHSSLYKHVFSTASVVLACWAAGAVAGPVATTPVDGGLGVVVAAMAVYAMVNGGLVAVVVALSARTIDVVTLLGDWDANVLEFATLALGALVAIVLPINPWLVGLVLPPVLVLHRAVLVRQLEVAAATDDKTGLLNAHTWNARAEHELRRTARHPTPHAVLVLDIDHFKAVNDRHGHLTGDQVLAAVASALRAEVRAGDLVGRFGGEEFVVLLVGQKGSPLTDVAAVAERIRLRVAHLQVEVGTPDGPTWIRDLSVSVGGAVHTGGRPDLTGLLLAADRALYDAKRAGRNQVQMSTVRPGGRADGV